MRLRPPDWLIYAGLVAGLAVGARTLREPADAPSAPPPPAGLSQTPLAPFAADGLVTTGRRETAAGTAFSIDDQGLWLTARHVVDGCRQVGLMVAAGRGVVAQVVARREDLALLRTQGGAPALALADAAALRAEEQVFLPGYPGGAPGEAAARLLGRQSLRQPGRGGLRAPVLAWAENGRTEGMQGSLAGLSGAPLLDGSGRVAAVALAEAPRRGRIYSSTPQVMAALAVRARPPSTPAVSITVDNYGRVADALRRDLSIAQVVCLSD